MPSQLFIAFATLERCRRAVTALALAVAGLIGGCAEMQPFDYRPIDQVKPGPGLLTGEDGEFVLYGSKEKSVLD